jgi:hypothetical protein
MVAFLLYLKWKNSLYGQELSLRTWIFHIRSTSVDIHGSRKTRRNTMKSSKRWYWVASLVVVLALAIAAARVKGDSATPALEKFQADGTAALSADRASLNGTIKGNEIGSAMITDNGYGGSGLGSTGNSSDSCFLGGGVVTITTKDGSTLTLARQGTLCTISGDGITDGVTANHVYIITGGTGRFAGASGNGNYTFGLNNSVVLIHIDGNIQAPADRDSH